MTAFHDSDLNFGNFEPLDLSESIGSNTVIVDHSRDNLLTDFSKATMATYLLDGETPQLMFARVANYFGSNPSHAQRLYDYMSNLWFLPASPILSNGGAKRGLCISCFINEPEDSLKGIVANWNECIWMAANGGGIGTSYAKLRSIGEDIKRAGKTSGALSFAKVQESLTLCISQGSLRRANSAIYLPINHPEIEEFIDMRKAIGGDPTRKMPHLHHGITISDKFLIAVEKNEPFDLQSPKTGKVIKTVSARELWAKILSARLEIGEPYLVFLDTVQRATPEMHKKLDLYATASNLCVEIMLPIGYDHLNKKRTAVCCLSSMNLLTWDQWHDKPQVIYDVMEFLDNVLEDFIKNAPEELANAKYSAMRERSVGLGVMGFHSFLQSKNVPFESALAKAWNNKFFTHLHNYTNIASQKLAKTRGPNPDAAENGFNERFTYKRAVAPTATISTMAGNTSPGVETIAANVYMQKTLHGNFTVKNQELQKLLIKLDKNTDEVWRSITLHKGSVQHLDFLTDDQKLVFKTAIEIDQRWVIDLAGDRAPFIDQAQSINVFFSPTVTKKHLHEVHMMAWKRGLKSLYYCRSQELVSAEHASHSNLEVKQREVHNKNSSEIDPINPQTYETCQACQ